MKEKLFKILKNVFLIWGIVSALGLLLIGVYLLYGITIGNKTTKDKATKEDVRFVLNWCELGDERIKEVTNSYQSARSLSGDHIDAYEIEVTKLTEEELKSSNYTQTGNFYRGDSLPKILDEAIDLADMSQEDFPWFPKKEEITTSNYYVRSWSISYHGTSVRSIKLTILNPKKKKVYYISSSM